MSYGNLIELSADASVLEERLADIDSKLADLGGEDTLDEDAVQRLIDNSDFVTSDDLDGRDYVDEARVEQIVRDLMHSEGDDFVQNIVSGMGLIDDSDLDSKIDDALTDYMTEAEVDDKIRDAATDTDMDEDAVRTIVESVTDGRLHTLEQRIEALQTQQEVILRDMNAFAERNNTAMTFFGLLKQAMALLRN